jgi:hypothetical protein
MQPELVRTVQREQGRQMTQAQLGLERAEYDGKTACRWWSVWGVWEASLLHCTTSK